MTAVRKWGFAYAALFVAVVAVGYVPGFEDDEGNLFGLFKLDLYDDALHLASGLWAGIAAALSDRAARGYFRSRASGSATPLRPSAWSFSHHARARDSCSRRLGAKLSGNIKARSLEPLPSRTMIVP